MQSGKDDALIKNYADGLGQFMNCGTLKVSPLTRSIGGAM